MQQPELKNRLQLRVARPQGSRPTYNLLVDGASLGMGAILDVTEDSNSVTVKIDKAHMDIVSTGIARVDQQ